MLSVGSGVVESAWQMSIVVSGANIFSHRFTLDILQDYMC